MPTEEERKRDFEIFLALVIKYKVKGILQMLWIFARDRRMELETKHLLHALNSIELEI